MLYKVFIKPFLFALHPEFAHDFTLWILKKLFYIPGFKQFLRLMYCVEDPRLEKDLFGIKFKNPVGLAAGFDKNAKVFNEFAAFGFGFVEVGTITPKPQDGNKKPRLFRLKKDQAIINRMGFNNDGADIIVKRIQKKSENIILGGNIGKNKATHNDLAASDYEICFKKTAPHVNYLVLNISSPNTPGLVDLQNKSDLKFLLSQVQSLNKKTYNKPILIKISPELSFSQIDQIIKLVKLFDIAGIIATNTSSKRDNLATSVNSVNKKGAGGLSGKPIFNKSKKIVSYIYKKSEGTIPIIAVGGIMTADDAIEMFNCGASLVQIYTGFIYNGPSIVKDINLRLLQS
ncbi:MAG: dihydroorotate dehydrogenase (quinone) [Flavobacteriales bacterium]|nr:dihydroorotate dehydrogenase (quinone) [Flavobacteriales bacterium]|tara:strand:+ start:1100 stop:2131 length:1032 start_codon:yes stop_codon:yes gene_type:complete